MGTRKERLLQKLNPALLKLTPKLSDDTGSFIDLDSKDSLEEGAKRLMMRFFRNQDLCEKNKRNSVENDSQVTVTSTKYNEKEEICEIITERLNLSLERNEDSDLFERPGRRLQKLKTELQEKMSAKWEEEYKKRVSESEALAGKNKKVPGQSDNHKCDTQDEDDIDRPVDEGDVSDAGDEADAESEGEENEAEEVPKCDDEEDFESRDSRSTKERSPEQDCEYEDSEACSLVPAYQPGGGLLYGGSELTQAEEELPQNLLSPSLRLNVNESPGSKMQSEALSDGTPRKSKYILNDDGDNSFSVKSKLFSQNPNNSFDLSDAFEFCSGKFPDGDQSALEEDSAGECDGDEEGGGNEDEFEEGEDGEEKNVSSESETEKEMPKTRKNILSVEDSEEEEEDERKTDEKEWAEAEEGLAGAAELLSEEEEEGGGGGGRKKKKRARLCYSDEEDSRSGWKEEAEGEGSGEEGEEEDSEKRSVQYDSEENEIMNPKEFFEKEAELSGSECSGDEDERGLDELEVEEGDADNVDSDAVRSQLEKIHIRYMIDDDVRNVRLLQEVLLEDGDLHSEGKGRERKLRWANIGGFETTGDEGRAEEGGGSSSEDDCAENEEQRKLRYEKELFLMKMKKNEDLSSDEELLKDVQMVKFITVKESGREDRGAAADVTGALNYSLCSGARGSFLARNEELLSRLAKATSSVSENVRGPKHSRNFVFASRSPEKVGSEGKGGCKRQMGDSGSCGRQEKRTKVSPPDAATEPSILDLLV